MTIGEAVAEVLRDWGDHPCLLELSRERGTVETSPAQFLALVDDHCTRLLDLGVRKGYFVPVFLYNSADFIAIFLALLQLGAVPVPVKMEYRRLELDEIFANCRPEAVVTAENHVSVLAPYLKGRAVLVAQNRSLSLLQTGEGRQPREDFSSEFASVNYTYRGYGYPLGAMVTHEQYLHGARVLQDGLCGNTGEKMLTLLPMAHIFTLVGCILVPLLYRMSCVITDTMHPHRLFSQISSLRIENVTSVPEVYSLLARVRDSSVDLSALKVFVSGGSLLSPGDYEELKNAFSVEVLHGYGLTEFAPVSRNMRGRARAGTIGPVCDGVGCRIDSAEPSSAGEILIKAPRVAGAYYGRQEEWKETQTDGWFRTGDLGRFDGNHLVFTGELKNTRKINGNMVDLEEVSRAIRLDPEVAEVQVKCEKNELSASIGVRRNVNLDEKVRQIRASLRDALAGYKIPKIIKNLGDSHG